MTKKMVMPWEDRPAGCADVMWRYSKNPVIDRYHIPSSNSIFNSAVVPFEDGFAGVFRCDNKAVQMNIFAGFSKDGIHWDIEHDPIKFKAGNTDNYTYRSSSCWHSPLATIFSPNTRKTPCTRPVPTTSTNSSSVTVTSPVLPDGTSANGSTSWTTTWNISEP